MTEFTLTINGQPASSPHTFSVLNPATGELVAEAPDCTKDQLDLAMRAASDAFPAWSGDERGRKETLRHAAQLVRGAAKELGPLFTQEQGRPLALAVGEIVLSADWLDYYAGLGLPATQTITCPGRSVEVSHRPVGPVAAITPWNAPILLGMWKIAPALAAGNTMVLKPSPFTPLTTLALGQVMQAALPPDVLNVISGLEPLGQQVVAHPVPRKISFTGSVPTGKAVSTAAAADLKRVTLELGGNDPAILLDDADIDEITESLFRGAFANSGQICEAVKRVYAPRRLYKVIVEALADRASRARVGNGLEPETELGPLTTPFQRDRIDELVTDAADHGATVVTGGRRVPGGGYFYEPTIISDVSDGVRIVDEEQFGPALPIIEYTDLDDAIRRANASMYGLGASVWSGDVARAREVASRLQTGRVKINTHGLIPAANAPFGGVKWSGLGVENGPWGLAEYTDLHVTEIGTGA